jgi:hypothetical protein
MASSLPSDKALSEYYLHRDVDCDITNESAPTGTSPYTSFDGTVSVVRVDGEEGVYLTIEAFVPVEEIPDLEPSAETESPQ